MADDVECCMSGCVHCVYNIYTDELETYTEALSSAHQALLSAGVSKSEWPAAVRKLDKKGEKQMQKEARGGMEEGMDPVMAGFLAMERRLKEKQLSNKGSTA